LAFSIFSTLKSFFVLSGTEKSINPDLTPKKVTGGGRFRVGEQSLSKSSNQIHKIRKTLFAAKIAIKTKHKSIPKAAKGQDKKSLDNLAKIAAFRPERPGDIIEAG